MLLDDLADRHESAEERIAFLLQRCWNGPVSKPCAAGVCRIGAGCESGAICQAATNESENARTAHRDSQPPQPAGVSRIAWPSTIAVSMGAIVPIGST